MVVPDDHTVVAQLTAFERLTAGAIAGGTAKSIIAPADRVKMYVFLLKFRRFSLFVFANGERNDLDLRIIHLLNLLSHCTN